MVVMLTFWIGNLTCKHPPCSRLHPPAGAVASSENKFVMLFFDFKEVEMWSYL